MYADVSPQDIAGTREYKALDCRLPSPFARIFKIQPSFSARVRGVRQYTERPYQFLQIGIGR